MPYIGFGLVAIILGLLLSVGSDSPDAMERSETFGLLLLTAGVIAVLIGMVTRVAQINRVDRRRP
jgi:hypothetical protein